MATVVSSVPYEELNEFKLYLATLSTYTRMDTIGYGAPAVAVTATGLVATDPRDGRINVIPFGVTDTVLFAIEVAPMLSVTFAVTVYVPPAAYVWDPVAPFTTVPSPKSIDMAATVPSVSVPLAVAETTTGATPPLGVTTRLALGAWFATVTCSGVFATCPAWFQACSTT